MCPLQDLTGDAVADTAKALDTAFAKFKIPILLDAADMVEEPDAHSIMTTVAYFRNYRDRSRLRAVIEARAVAKTRMQEEAAAKEQQLKARDEMRQADIKREAGRAAAEAAQLKARALAQAQAEALAAKLKADEEMVAAQQAAEANARAAHEALLAAERAKSEAEKQEAVRAAEEAAKREADAVAAAQAAAKAQRKRSAEAAATAAQEREARLEAERQAAEAQAAAQAKEEAERVAAEMDKRVSSAQTQAQAACDKALEAENSQWFESEQHPSLGLPEGAVLLSNGLLRFPGAEFLPNGTLAYGAVQTEIWYQADTSQLHVHIVQACCLPKCDAYIKLYLMPDPKKNTKIKSKVMRNKRNPKWNETMSYEISRTDLPFKQLYLSVWARKTLGSNDAVGQLQMALSDVASEPGRLRWTVLAPPEAVEYADGTVELEDGSTRQRKKDGGLVLPQSEAVAAEKEAEILSRAPQGSTLTGDGSVEMLDGTVCFRDGSVRLPSGQLLSGSGATLHANGTVEYPDGSIRSKDGKLKLKDGKRLGTGRTDVGSSGSSQSLNLAQALASLPTKEPVSPPTARFLLPCGSILHEDGTIVLPSGSEVPRAEAVAAVPFFLRPPHALSSPLDGAWRLGGGKQVRLHTGDEMDSVAAPTSCRGFLRVGVWFDKEKNKLGVRVAEAAYLTDEGAYYCSVELMGRQDHPRVKTKTMRRTRAPQWHHTSSFKIIGGEDFVSQSDDRVCITLWQRGGVGNKKEAISQLWIPVREAQRASSPVPRWEILRQITKMDTRRDSTAMNLDRKLSVSQAGLRENPLEAMGARRTRDGRLLLSDGSLHDFSSIVKRGFLKTCIWFEEASNSLHVQVLQGRHLPSPRSALGISLSPYVKLYLSPDPSMTTKRKTKAQKGTSDPIFEESFRFKLLGGAEELAHKQLLMSVIDSRVGKSVVLGRLELSLAATATQHAKGVAWHVLSKAGKVKQVPTSKSGTPVVSKPASPVIAALPSPDGAGTTSAAAASAAGAPPRPPTGPRPSDALRPALALAFSSPPDTPSNGAVSKTEAGDEAKQTQTAGQDAAALPLKANSAVEVSSGDRAGRDEGPAAAIIAKARAQAKAERSRENSLVGEGSLLGMGNSRQTCAAPRPLPNMPDMPSTTPTVSRPPRAPGNKSGASGVNSRRQSTVLLGGSVGGQRSRRQSTQGIRRGSVADPRAEPSAEQPAPFSQSVPHIRGLEAQKREMQRQSIHSLLQQEKERKTARRQQDKPASEWITCKAEDGTTFYHNSVTKVSQWTKPESLQGRRASAASSYYDDDTELGEDSDDEDEDGEWTEYISQREDSLGSRYYVHNATGETVWERPVSLAQATTTKRRNSSLLAGKYAMLDALTVYEVSAVTAASVLFHFVLRCCLCSFADMPTP